MKYILRTVLQYHSYKRNESPQKKVQAGAAKGDTLGLRTFFWGLSRSLLLGWNALVGEYVVDYSVLFSLVRHHKVVAVDVLLYLLQRLAGGLGEYFVEALPSGDDVLGGYLDVGGLSLRPAPRLG